MWAQFPGTLKHPLEQRHFVHVGISDDCVPDSVPVDRHRPHLKISNLNQCIKKIYTKHICTT